MSAADLSDPNGIGRAVRRAARPGQRMALLLALPLLAFLLVTFCAPIGLLLATSLGNREPAQVLPRTMAALEGWDQQALPDAAVFTAFVADLAKAQQERTAALLGKRLNYEWPGLRSKIVSAARLAAVPSERSAKDRLLSADAEWGSVDLWRVIARNAAPVTPAYLLSAVDLERAPDGSLRRVEAEQAVFLPVLGRTLLIAAMVTILTLLLGYPVAYAIAIAPPAWSSVMLLLVLMPLWTSLLVRSTAWVVLLQTDGVINDLLLASGLIRQRVQLIFTRLGTVTAMVHIQLPFTILPIYAVMRSISTSQLRAARSLGAPPLSAFWRIYAPQTLPGVIAGCLMTFILSLGYYITPALVGGPSDQMISNFISIYINRDLNWGLASALGVVLLTVTLAIYFLFLRLVGAERIRFA